MEGIVITQEGHYFSDEDIIFNIKWQIHTLYHQGCSDSEILDALQEVCMSYSIDARIELEKIKRVSKK